MEAEDHVRGQRLLNAVERIVAPPEEFTAIARRFYAQEEERLPDLPELVRARAADAIIRHYALNTAIGGGLASLPAIIPGVGTAAAVLGGGLADMTVCLKYEVEMIMALASLFGHDLQDPKERSYCLLLAGLSTYQEMAGRNPALDFALASGEAIWHYSPRQVAKLLASVFLRLALLALSRGVLRSLPIAGAIVGFAANKVLTQRVGKRALEDLRKREAEHGAPTRPDDGEATDVEAEEAQPAEAPPEADAAEGVPDPAAAAAPEAQPGADAEIVDATVVDAAVGEPEAEVEAPGPDTQAEPAAEEPAQEPTPE